LLCFSCFKEEGVFQLKLNLFGFGLAATSHNPKNFAASEYDIVGCAALIALISSSFSSQNV